MTFRTLLTLKAAVCLVFGVLLLAAPGPLFGMLGASLGAAGLFAAREYAAAMFGTLLLTWLARNATSREARGPILWDLLVYDAIGVVITLGVVFSGVLNVLGLGIVGIYLLFAAGSGYLLVRERAARRIPAAAARA